MGEPRGGLQRVAAALRARGVLSAGEVDALLEGRELPSLDDTVEQPAPQPTAQPDADQAAAEQDEPESETQLGDQTLGPNPI